MARRKSEEPAFNSDSFLDIVCNLVGIMIILIIVAGLRVSRAPVTVAESEPAPPAPASSETLHLASPAMPPTGIKTAELADWLELPPDAPGEPAAQSLEISPAEPAPDDLIARSEELRRQIAGYARHKADLDARESAARRQRSALEERLSGLSALLESAKLQAQADADGAAASAWTVTQLEAESAELARKEAALAEQRVEARVLRHTVTPVSRKVSNNDELHFRLSGNGVAVIPLESLAEALKFRMERSRDLFLRINRYEGTAGPVDGFLMRYVIEKQTPTAIEELRNGGPFFRIQLAYYELDAGPDVVAESAEQALTPGSRFRNALSRARPGTSLTFWVYPDSFELHRILQDYAHEARFDVAARPLPLGVPIAGSPHGSRSEAQ